LAPSKQAAQKFYVDLFNPRKLHELDIRKKYQNDITNRFVSFQNLCDFENINRASLNVKENI